MGAGTVVGEFALAFGLWIPRLRWWLIAFGVVLHASIYLALPVATFSATILFLYLAYFDPDAVHRFIDDVLAPPVPPHQSLIDTTQVAHSDAPRELTAPQ